MAKEPAPDIAAVLKKADARPGMRYINLFKTDKGWQVSVMNTDMTRIDRQAKDKSLEKALVAALSAPVTIELSPEDDDFDVV